MAKDLPVYLRPNKKMGDGTSRKKKEEEAQSKRPTMSGTGTTKKPVKYRDLNADEEGYDWSSRGQRSEQKDIRNNQQAAASSYDKDNWSRFAGAAERLNAKKANAAAYEKEFGNNSGRKAGSVLKRQIAEMKSGSKVKDQQNNPNVTGRVASTKKATASTGNKTVKKTWDPNAEMKRRREEAVRKKGR